LSLNEGEVSATYSGSFKLVTHSTQLDVSLAELGVLETNKSLPLPGIK